MGGIELERCLVRGRSREKHPVRGPRQSADSRQVTRDGTIMGSRKGIGVRHTWEPSFRIVDLRGVAELSSSRGFEGRKFAWWAQENARSIGREWGQGTKVLRAWARNFVLPRFLLPLTARISRAFLTAPIKILISDRRLVHSQEQQPQSPRPPDHSQDGPQEDRSSCAGEHLPGPPGPGG